MQGEDGPPGLPGLPGELVKLLLRFYLKKKKLKDAFYKCKFINLLI